MSLNRKRTEVGHQLRLAYVRIRHTCEVGEACPSLTFDTKTGNALVGGPVDTAAAAALGFPDGEGVIRIPARDVARVLYGIGPGTFSGQVSP
ncbi:MAG: hypothetical protein ACRDTF_03970 [Pseudonocardiaceae bacterium]